MWWMVLLWCKIGLALVVCTFVNSYNISTSLHDTKREDKVLGEEFMSTQGIFFVPLILLT